MNPKKMDHDSRKLILDNVKKIVFDRLREKSAKVYLFGSWARFEEKRSSDIDVAIEFDVKEDNDRKTLMYIRQTLNESNVPYNVDVVHLNTADDYIVKKVREEGSLWVDQLNEPNQHKKQ